MQHFLDIIEHLISSDALSLRDSCPQLVIGDNFVAEVQKQILITIRQDIFKFFSGEFVETVDELEISCNWSHNSLDLQ